jgi:hypothetical protein
MIALFGDCNRKAAAPRFAAVGKILCAPLWAPSTAAPKDLSGKQFLTLAEIIATQTEILEGGEMHRRALERVRAMHPEFTGTDVQIKVSHAKDSAILNVTAIGGEPQYARIFCSALLDEYIAFFKEMTEPLEHGLSRLLEQVLSWEKRLGDAKRDLEERRRAGAPPDVLARLEKEISEGSNEHEYWKRVLERVEPPMKWVTPVGIIERPVTAVEIR